MATLTAMITTSVTAVAGSSTSVWWPRRSRAPTVLTMATTNTGRPPPVYARRWPTETMVKTRRAMALPMDDGAQVEPDGQHDGDGRGDQGRPGLAAEPTPSIGGNWPTSAISSHSPVAGYSPELVASGGEQGGDRHHPVAGPAEHRLGGAAARCRPSR